MFENNYPLFTPGRILKTKMLTELRDYPREFINIKYRDYSDGIIAGCDIEVTDNFLIIKKGIIKHGETIYIMTEDKPLRYENNNKLTLVKLRFLSETRDNDFIKYSTEAYLDENETIKEDEMELCRFKLRSGAVLRGRYVSFNDFSTEFDTVNIINVPFAGTLGKTLNPKLTKAFGRGLLKCNSKDNFDISFAYLCIQEKDAIEKEIILDYLKSKLNFADRDYSNEEIYYFLLQALEKAGEGNREDTKERKGRYKRILID